MFKKLVQNSKFKIQNYNKKGFSIMEVIISAFVLSVGIMGTVGLISSSIRHSIDSRDHIIASGLAQEGIELVRNIRDNDFLNGSFGQNFPPVAANNCRADKNSTSITIIQNCGNTNSKKLYYKNGFYVHDNAGSVEETKFQRKIIFAYPSPTQANITGMVIWGRADNDFPTTANCNTASKCVYTEDILTDWKK